MDEEISQLLRSLHMDDEFGLSEDKEPESVKTSKGMSWKKVVVPSALVSLLCLSSCLFWLFLSPSRSGSFSCQVFHQPFVCGKRFPAKKGGFWKEQVRFVGKGHECMHPDLSEIVSMRRQMLLPLSQEHTLS